MKTKTTRELMYQEKLLIRKALERYTERKEISAEERREAEELQWALKDAARVVLEG